MRNRFAHGYGKMDINKIYYTAIEDIPVVEEFVNKELNKSKKIKSDQKELFEQWIALKIVLRLPKYLKGTLARITCQSYRK